MHYEIRQPLREYSFISIEGAKADDESYSNRDKGNNNVECHNDEIGFI